MGFTLQDWVGVGGAVAGGFSGAVAYWGLSVRRRARSVEDSANQARRGLELAGSEASPKSSPGAPAPVPPDALVAACAQGECVLFTGAGLTASQGVPTWREALLAVIARAQDSEPGGEHWAQLAGEVRDAHYDRAMELLITRMGRDQVLGLLREMPRETSRTPESRLQRDLRNVHFSGVIASAWDDLTGAMFADRDPVILVPGSGEAFGDALRRREFFLLMAYGRLSGPDRILTADDFRREVDVNSDYARFLRSIYATRTLLFVGAGVTGVEDFLRCAASYGPSERTHYALVPRSADAELISDRLRERFNLELLQYDADPQHSQVQEFSAELARRDREQLRITGRSVHGPAPLTGVSLRNIGPFGSLDLGFAAGWNTLVADNGCGKSTVLRAIAMALCGNDDRAVRTAGRLLKAGQKSGSIELRFGADTFVTRLIRDRTRVRVESELVTPVQTGDWLVLGFPPLRGVSTRRPEPPTGQRPLGPGVEDLLPLVTGDVDERLDDLKQWIVNRTFAEVTRHRGTSTTASSVKRFFRVAAAMMPEIGYWLEFSRIDHETLEVMVRTPDGELPLQMLSQGISSVIGWTGTLISRLEDVETAGVPPGGIRGIVLVDEIDGHLHPKWQRKIVGAIREEFPTVQVIATTHSPLLVGSIPDVRLIHLRREKGQIHVSQFDHDYRGMRADQILASPPFDTSPRDEETEDLINEYRRLVTLDEPSSTDEQRLQQVAGQLQEAIPSPGERREARAAQEIIQAAADQQIQAIPPDDQEQVLAELKLQIQQAMIRPREQP